MSAITAEPGPAAARPKPKVRNKLDATDDRTEAPEEADELERIVDTIKRYEAKRWPDE